MKKENIQKCFFATLVGNTKLNMVVGLVLAAWVLAMGVGRVHAALLQRGISREILRFHVLANSDSEEDQSLKLYVRDEVLGWLDQQLDEKEMGSRERMRDAVSDLLPEIQETAEMAVSRWGADDPVSVEFTEEYFPEKSYGNCTFPAGNYLALKISLGQARGHNWWCVLFPRLCFLDCVHAVLPEESEEQLRGVLTEEEYESLFDPEEDPYVIRFRYF